VDTRDTPEQAELRRTARRLAAELGPGTVAGLDDGARRARLAAAVRDAGWLDLRRDGGDGPVAGGVEAAIVADALGGAVADVPFIGPLLADDLARRAGADRPEDAVVAFAPGLVDPAGEGGPMYALDAGEVVSTVLAVAPDRGGRHPVQVAVDGEPGGPATDLTRAVRAVTGTSESQRIGTRALSDGDVAAWRALGLALTSADLVGVMRGVLDATVAYARERNQFGVPVGTFQAVQHLLAEAHCLMEGSRSVVLHASWAVDNLPPGDAVGAGRVAKAYCVRAARTVCETAVQVHGGIGNTWDCMVHVYLRRALLSSQWFGDDGEQLRAIDERLVGGS
jgi:alkylation response protein AidB-like acyl-CoA dehydrogenase